ncbi:HAD family phosphatase [Janthinobacterium sp.]|uniref:HAD family hydrolase n=1 Tax=Janthinobacterium sp. TaxID=1871054 RepID=UPI00293D85A1|nr:HAD family phosphatase [Janthinobacterium sp.]
MNIAMQTPQLMLWDLDGTLIRSEELHQEAIRQACRALGRPTDGELDIPPGSDGAAAYRHLFGISPGQALPDQYAAWYRMANEYVIANLAGTEAVGGALECCAWFAARGVSQSVVSNSDPRVIDASLRHLGIRGRFEHLCSGDEVARGKPAPDVYLHALALHGVDAASCLVFEDSRNGMTAAKAAGLRVVAVTDSLRLAAQADFTVSPSRPESWQALLQRLF